MGHGSPRLHEILLQIEKGRKGEREREDVRQKKKKEKEDQDEKKTKKRRRRRETEKRDIITKTSLSFPNQPNTTVQKNKPLQKPEPRPHLHP